MIGYCIMSVFVVATTFFVFFRVNEALLRCCVVVVAKLKIVACPALKEPENVLFFCRCWLPGVGAILRGSGRGILEPWHNYFT